MMNKLIDLYIVRDNTQKLIRYFLSMCHITEILWRFVHNFLINSADSQTNRGKNITLVDVINRKVIQHEVITCIKC